MTEQMIQTVQNRMNEMLQCPKVKAYLNTFATAEEAQNQLMLAAVATLMGAFE